MTNDGPPRFPPPARNVVSDQISQAPSRDFSLLNEVVPYEIEVMGTSREAQYIEAIEADELLVINAVSVLNGIVLNLSSEFFQL